MGNNQIKQTNNKGNFIIIRDKNCIICYEKISGNCISCLKCRVLSHHKCYFKWKETNTFEECPMCKSLNSMITSSLHDEFKIDYGKI